jgi:cell filamentation protein
MDEWQWVEQREGALSFARIGELDDDPVQGKFDAAHLKEIHRRIFQDLPHHAPGEYRPDAPAHIKGRALESSFYRYHVHYAPRSRVDAGVEKTLAEFGGPDALRGLNAGQFSARMAKLYGDMDYLHPFKEGNSRTLRAFTTQLAREAGRELDWGTTNADAASRDRLYIARDKEVTQRAFPGLDQARAMKTESRAEYEAYVRVLAPFAEADTLQALIMESIGRS